MGYQSLDANGNVIEVNQAWQSVLDYSKEEVLGRSFVDFLHPDQRDYFKAEPDSNTFRIVVQGGSSAAGYPLYYGGSFSRMLEQRLLQSFPGKPIEVINTAMAAVNSYTLLDLADEIIEQRPDLVLIYAGHNEYYGSLGVGSAESLGRFPGMVNLYLELQHLRVVRYEMMHQHQTGFQ